MKEIKIEIPDNCVMVKHGNSYVVKEKNNTPPRSWKEFCENYPRTLKEAYINSYGDIVVTAYLTDKDKKRTDTEKSLCSSKEEAEAFLSLMQLRQLRKAWIGDFTQCKYNLVYVIRNWLNEGTCVTSTEAFNHPLSFPDKEMAEDFSFLLQRPL